MLTQQQIVEITSLCQSMGVKYYDVQLELVDHIAGMIDQTQEEKPELNFEDALQLAIKEFSPTEFKLIVKNKEQQLLKRFTRLWVKEFLAYFTVPKILVTLMFVALVIFIAKYLRLEWLLNYLPISVGLFSFYFLREDDILNKFKKLNIQKEATLPLLIHQVLTMRNFIILVMPYAISIILILIQSSIYRRFYHGDHTFFLSIGYKFILYPFPLFILALLAWRKVYLDQNNLMRQQYSAAFEN